VVEVEVRDEEALDVKLRMGRGKLVGTVAGHERGDRAHMVPPSGESFQEQCTGQSGASGIGRQRTHVQDAQDSTHRERL
jgi:hypothetical protein